MEPPAQTSDVEIIFGTPDEATMKSPNWQPWMGFLAYSKSRDQIFVPSQLAKMNVTQAILACGYDHTPFIPIADEKDPQKTLVVLVPIDWAEKENPDRSDIFAAVRERSLAVWPKTPQPTKETPCPETSKQMKI